MTACSERRAASGAGWRVRHSRRQARASRRCFPRVAARDAAWRAELEEKIPWSAVKKKWTPKRQSWLNSVQHASNLTALIKRLCMLEAALKQESLEPSWPARRDEWRAEARRTRIRAREARAPLPSTARAMPRA